MTKNKMDPPDAPNKAKIVISRNGPYIISGCLPLGKEIIVADNEGIPTKWQKGANYPVQQTYALCRCGESKHKPHCDGMHAKIDFDGTETASRESCLAQSEKIIGPDLILTDAEKFCAVALFCHRAGDTWNLTEHSDDPKSKEIAIQEACDCPSGRLVAWNKQTGEAIEPNFKPSISLVEDPAHQVSGPLWVKGGVPIESADGTPYETRNRVTLCRCGKSTNKPYCDGSHITAGFTDGDESLCK